MTSVGRALAIVLLAVAAGACSGSSPRMVALNASKAEGLIVGTVTCEAGLGEHGLLLKSDTHEKFFFLLLRGDYGCVSFDEQLQSRGGTVVLPAPAGKYRIVGWRRAQGPEVDTNALPISLSFTVAPGKASYLGNLHFDEHRENIRLRDMSERDLPVLRRRYEAFAKAPLEYTIAKGFNAENFGGGYLSGFIVRRRRGYDYSSDYFLSNLAQIGPAVDDAPEKATIQDFFGFVPPTGAKWSVIEESAGYTAYGKGLGPPQQTATASVRFARIDRGFRSKDEFLAHVLAGRKSHSTPDRATVLLYEEALDNTLPLVCTKYRLKLEDKVASRASGALLFVESKGFTCVHPGLPILVTIEYSEKSGSPFSDPETLEEGEKFITSLEFK